MGFNPFLSGLAIGASNQAVDILNDARNRSENASAARLQADLDMKKQQSQIDAQESAEVKKSSDLTKMGLDRGNQYINDIWNDPARPLSEKLLLAPNYGIDVNNVMNANYLQGSNATPMAVGKAIHGIANGDTTPLTSDLGSETLSPDDRLKKASSNLQSSVKEFNPLETNPFAPAGARETGKLFHEKNIQAAQVDFDAAKREADINRNNPEILEARRVLLADRAVLQSTQDMKDVVNANSSGVGAQGLITRHIQNIEGAIDSLLAKSPKDSIATMSYSDVEKKLKELPPDEQRLSNTAAARVTGQIYWNLIQNTARQMSGSGKISNYDLQQAKARWSNGWYNSVDRINDEMNAYQKQVGQEVKKYVTDPHYNKYDELNTIPPELHRAQLDWKVLPDSQKIQQLRASGISDSIIKKSITQSKYPNYNPIDMTK